MRVFGRDCTFRRHSCVAECVRAGPMREIEAPRDRVRQTDILEHLDALAKPESAEFGMTIGRASQRIPADFAPKVKTAWLQ